MFIIYVVVWCRNRMNYNYIPISAVSFLLWFDVEIEWITTSFTTEMGFILLWFDVEIEWITTQLMFKRLRLKLWFDVEIEWITT